MIVKADKVKRQFLRKRGESNVFNAVDETDFELAEGKFTVVTGRSGSGKSTLLNMMSGLLAPTSGTITADGKNLYRMDDKQLSLFRNKNFGLIPQGQTAIFSLNVFENIMLPLTIYGVEKKSRCSMKKRRNMHWSFWSLRGFQS